MKVQIEVEVPDDCDIREELWEIQATAQEAVSALYRDYLDEVDYQDVIDPQGRV